MPRFPTPKIFTPKNPMKYIGDVNNIVCRSGIEFRYMKFFDENPSILKYSSEEIIIEYIHPVDRKPHRYFPDFMVQIKTKSGEKKNLLIEIKPSSDLVKPVKGKKQTKTFLSEAITWEVNQAKWAAAKKWAAKRNMEFKVFTEKEIKLKFVKK